MAGSGMVVQNWRPEKPWQLFVWCPLCTQLGSDSCPSGSRCAALAPAGQAPSGSRGCIPHRVGGVCWHLTSLSVSAAPMYPFCYSLANLNYGNQLLTWNMVISLVWSVPWGCKTRHLRVNLFYSSHSLYGSPFLSFSSVVCKARCCSSIKWQNHSTPNYLRKHNFSRMF